MKHQDVRKMTREIKFRAWDEEKREMFEVSGMRWKDGMVTGDDTWYGDDFLAPAERVSSTLMQYTGLKDKNGVEIYEGDIVTSPYGGGTPAVIEWGQVSDDGEHPVSFGWKFGDVLLGSDVAGDYQYTEVIGNIYEHPHLLQDHEQTS